nr:hypothetical protein [Tanacetum cinerariifolium]
MDDPNITMEEYIRPKEEKARRHGKVYNRESATYDRYWSDDNVHWKPSHPINLFTLPHLTKPIATLAILKPLIGQSNMTKETKDGINLIEGQGKWRVMIEVLSSLITEAQLAHIQFVFEYKCALLRKKFKKDLFTYCIENGILQDSSEPSNDNTNVVNALQKPFVVKHDPGKNSSQSPPQINHHCCYGCGDSLEDIFCHQCTCEFCGKGAHYGYNCPPKVSVVSNMEPCHNQNVDELPQTVPSFDPTCYFEDGNSFTFDSRYDLVHDSLSF